MKTKKYVVALAVVAFALSACGEKNANVKPDASDAEKPAATVSAEATESQDDVSEIVNIGNIWDTRPLSVDAKGKTAGIEDFAKAFAKAYGEYKPNKVMYNHLTGNRKANDADELLREFEVYVNAKSGYLGCELPTEYDWLTTCCYWRRDNGHSLVAFWLSEAHEGSDTDDTLLAFYDYDPATGTMTPEPKLARKIDMAMQRYDAYTVRLPEQGKDIEVTGHKADHENDNYVNTQYLFRWNGNDFRMEEVK